MLIALALQLLTTTTPTTRDTIPAAPLASVYNGRTGATHVALLRLDGEARVDGELDEPQWTRASVLTGFSLYQPVDERPAPDSTDVLIWYSPTALYVGIRAYETHAPVHATLADRDKISADDNVLLFLDTFDDRRRAYVFGVNPLGIQADGMRSEGSGAGLAGGGAPGQNDLSPDFAFESKGRLTPFGYQVEIRIPFTSLRYPLAGRMTWGLNVQRTVQHSGYVETWTAAHRASASFLSESGVLEGISGLHRGMVLELNPEATAHVNGSPAVPVSGATGRDTAWHRTGASQLGGNVKYDLNSALTVNGTIRPDFSQVEADATQIATDPRFALYYPEKRPFFIDGIEQFDTPNLLVYTRRIVQPLVATKLTGTVMHTDVALLNAVDDRAASSSGADHPVFNILRVRRDLTGRSTLGVLYTDRTERPDVNRVLSGDLRIVFAKLYFAQFQGAFSSTRTNTGTTTSPLWDAIVDRTGRSFGFHYSLTGIAPGFNAASGFVARNGIVSESFRNRFTLYGPPGALLENYTFRFFLDGVWDYETFFRAGSVLEGLGTWDNVLTFRGGWILTVTPLFATYAFDPKTYAQYGSANPVTGDTTAFRVSDRLGGSTLRFSLTTPQFQHLSATVGGRVGSDVDLLETDAARRADFNAVVDWLPTRQIRVHGSYGSSALTRTSDGVRVATARIPRVAVEYQIARPVFVRLVGQYDAEFRAPLTDPRTGGPLLVRTNGAWTLPAGTTANGFRTDGLFAYQPTPGTVFFLGYGESLQEPEPLSFRQLHRTSDVLFAKVSYLFR